MDTEIKNTATPGNLLHAVGQDWKGFFTFVFLRNKADEARMVADGIIPYFCIIIPLKSSHSLIQKL